MTTYAIQLQQNLQNAWMLAKEHIATTQRCQKFYYDRNAFLPSFYPSQCVLCRISALPTMRCKKFAFCWYGPFHILELQGVNTITQPCHKPHQEPETVHINKLKPCYFQDIPEVEKVKTQPEEADSSDKEKSDSENKPLIQYALQAKETTV